MTLTSPLALLRSLKSELSPMYLNESDSIALLVTEYLTGLSRTAILMDQHVKTGPQFNERVKKVVQRLKNEEPVQYIIGEAHFMGYDFKVNEYTLIPRSETEELVDTIIKEANIIQPKTILDIGTGSGCIAVTLALNTTAQVEAIDISPEALKIAQVNAHNLKANVSFTEHNILDTPLAHSYDLIVSNPPYVLEQEKELMKNNVLNYEPTLALFVEDTKPLLFYEAIAKQAIKRLNKGGKLFFEINEAFGNMLVEMLTNMGFLQVEVWKDMQNKDRFIKATKP